MNSFYVVSFVSLPLTDSIRFPNDYVLYHCFLTCFSSFPLCDGDRAGFVYSYHVFCFHLLLFHFFISCCLRVLYSFFNLSFNSPISKSTNMQSETFARLKSLFTHTQKNSKFKILSHRLRNIILFII